MHIPMLEYIDAYENGEIVASYNNNLVTKKINTTKENSALYDAIKKYGNNKLIATGHTHAQDYARLYEEMLWLQVRAGGYGVWNGGLDKGGASIAYNFDKTKLTEKYYIANVNFD